jgi:hypothetical protein
MSVDLNGDSWRPAQDADAIKEKFLDQQMLMAQVNMLRKHVRIGQGNALRDRKTALEVRA